MATIKVKFRPSSVPNREGTIYYQIVHHRVCRQFERAKNAGRFFQSFDLYPLFQTDSSSFL